MTQRPYTQFRPVTPGTVVAPGDGVFIASSSSGWIRLISESNQNLDVYIPSANTVEIGKVRIQGVATSGAPSPAATGFVVTVAAR